MAIGLKQPEAQKLKDDEDSLLCFPVVHWRVDKG